MPSSEGFVIQVNKHSHPRRQRFTVAHEIGHSFFGCGKNEIKLRQGDLGGEERVTSNLEEFLCDMIASELLMPSRFFNRDHINYHLSLRSVHGLANRFQTSMQATAIRMVELAEEPSVLIYWHESDCSGAQEKKLRIKWSAYNKELENFSPFIPKHVAANEESNVWISFAEEKFNQGMDNLNVGEIRGRFFSEHQPRRWKDQVDVMSLIFPERSEWPN